MDTPSVLKGVTVLVVDDHRTTRLVATLVLEKSGARVIEAPDGEAALQALAVHKVDVIVSDVEMPRLNGLGMLRMLGFPAPHPGTPPVYLHSGAPRDYAAEAASLGLALHPKADVLTALVPRLAAMMRS
ncbi:response regulator [Silanimonas algicola]